MLPAASPTPAAPATVVPGCADGTYMHQKTCLTSCPSGYYGDRGGTSAVTDSVTPLVAASQPPWTCKPCVAGCTKCHDAINCVDCTTTCSIPSAIALADTAASTSYVGVATAGDDGKQQQQCAQTCSFTFPPLPPPLGPGGSSGGPRSGTPIWPTVDVIFNVTIPQKVNIKAGNTTYTSLDVCGVNSTHNTKTLVTPGPDGNSEQLWCSWWSPARHEWVREGCSADRIYQSVNSSANTTAPATETTVTCNCAVVIPPDKSLAFAGGTCYHAGSIS